MKSISCVVVHFRNNKNRNLATSILNTVTKYHENNDTMDIFYYNMRRYEYIITNVHQRLIDQCDHDHELLLILLSVFTPEEVYPKALYGDNWDVVPTFVRKKYMDLMCAMNTVEKWMILSTFNYMVYLSNYIVFECTKSIETDLVHTHKLNNFEPFCVDNTVSLLSASLSEVVMPSENVSTLSHDLRLDSLFKHLQMYKTMSDEELCFELVRSIPIFKKRSDIMLKSVGVSKLKRLCVKIFG